MDCQGSRRWKQCNAAQRCWEHAGDRHVPAVARELVEMDRNRGETEPEWIVGWWNKAFIGPVDAAAAVRKVGQTIAFSTPAKSPLCERAVWLPTGWIRIGANTGLRAAELSFQLYRVKGKQPNKGGVGAGRNVQTAPAGERDVRKKVRDRRVFRGGPI